MSWKDKEGVKEPPFIKVYLNDISKLNNLTSMQHKVLYGLMKCCDYGNSIEINSRVKNKIMSDNLIANGTFKNALSVLTSKGIIAKNGKRGNYIISPYLVFKGKINDRAKLIIVYDELGNKESIEVENG